LFVFLTLMAFEDSLFLSFKNWQLNNNCLKSNIYWRNQTKGIWGQAKTKKVHPSYVHSQKNFSSDIHAAFSFCIHCAHQNLSNPIFKYYETSKFHSHNFKQKVFNFVIGKAQGMRHSQNKGPLPKVMVKGEPHMWHIP
jgi:hypothetical protein